MPPESSGSSSEGSVGLTVIGPLELLDGPAQDASSQRGLRRKYVIAYTSPRPALAGANARPSSKALGRAPIGSRVFGRRLRGLCSLCRPDAPTLGARRPGGRGFERRVLALNGGRPHEAARARWLAISTRRTSASGCRFVRRSIGGATRTSPSRPPGGWCPTPARSAHAAQPRNRAAGRAHRGYGRRDLAYRHYLALRPNPEPEVKPETDRVRAGLSRLRGDR